MKHRWHPVSKSAFLPMACIYKWELEGWALQASASQNKHTHVNPASNSMVSLTQSYSSTLGLLPNRPVTSRYQGKYIIMRQQLLPSMVVKGTYKPLHLCTYRKKTLPCNILLLLDKSLIIAHLRSHWLVLPSLSSCKAAGEAFLTAGQISQRDLTKGRDRPVPPSPAWA